MGFKLPTVPRTVISQNEINSLIEMISLIADSVKPKPPPAPTKPLGRCRACNNKETREFSPYCSWECKDWTEQYEERQNAKN